MPQVHVRWSVTFVVHICVYLHYSFCIVWPFICEFTQDASSSPDYSENSYEIEPLPGLEIIFQELLQEDGYAEHFYSSGMLMYCLFFFFFLLLDFILFYFIFWHLDLQRGKSRITSWSFCLWLNPQNSLWYGSSPKSCHYGYWCLKRFPWLFS